MNYTVKLGSNDDHDVPLKGRLVGEILEALDVGSKKVVRLQIEGQSDIAGTYPKALLRGAEYELIGVDHHPSRLTLAAARLQDAITDETLLSEVPPEVSGVGLFAQGMREAIAGDTSSELVDENVISTFLELGRFVERGVGAISITNGKPGAQPVVLRPSSIEQIRNFKVEVPQPRTVRLSGVVNAIRHSDASFSLILASGKSLRGTLANGPGSELRKFYAQTVIVSGKVSFRSSGRPLLLEATHIARAEGSQAAQWADDPIPLEGPRSNVLIHKKQGPRSGMNAVFGRWPVDVSDEDVLRITHEEK